MRLTLEQLQRTVDAVAAQLRERGKRRIRQNIWGNWYGYVGNRRVREFGTDEPEAREWVGLPRYERWEVR